MSLARRSAYRTAALLLVALVFAMLAVRSSLLSGASIAGAIIFWAYVSTVSLSLGDAMVVLAGLGRIPAQTRVLLAWSAGFSALAFVNAVLVQFLPPLIAFWLIFAAALSWASLRAAMFLKRRWAAVPEGQAAAAALVAMIVAVASAGSRMVALEGPATRPFIVLAQHRDVLYHVAMAREAFNHGIPWRTNPTLTGAPWQSYHAAFDSLSVTLARGAGVDVGPLVTGLMIPATFLAVVIASSAVASIWSDRQSAAYSTAAIVLLSLFARTAPNLWLSQGDFGHWQVAYFLHNPPAALAMGSILSGIAILGIAEKTSPVRPLPPHMVAAALIAASTAMKANLAIAFVPALAVAVTVLLLRRGISLRVWLASMGSAATVGLLSLLVTRGESPGLAVKYGMFAEWLPGQRFMDPFLAQVGQLLREVGDLGPIYIIVLYLVVGVLGARLIIVALVALVSQTARDNMRSWPRTHRTSLTLLASLAVITVVIGATLVQKDTGRFEAWNLASHTMPGMYWIGIAIAGAAVSLLLRSGAKSTVTPIALVILLVVLAVPARIAMRDTRETGNKPIPPDFVRVLELTAEKTPDDAVVVQNFDPHLNSWVAGISGRRSPLERAELWLAYYPEIAAPRLERIRALYGSESEGTARRYARELEVDYVIASSSDSPSLRAAGTTVASSGEWVLLRFD